MGQPRLVAHVDQRAARRHRRVLPRIEVQPSYGEAHWNLALALLRQGDFEQGFREYEWRLAVTAFRGSASPPGPRWSGGDVAGKTLLVIAEQGLGDAIHFLRFARDAALRGARVIVEVPRALARLAASAPGVAAVSISGEPRPAHDTWIPLMSMAGALGLTAPPIDFRVPYLSTDRIEARRSQRRWPMLRRSARGSVSPGLARATTCRIACGRARCRRWRRCSPAAT